MPSQFLRAAASRALQQLTVYAPASDSGSIDPTTGRMTYNPTTGSGVTVYGDIQPAGGNLHLIPVGFQADATEMCFADPSTAWKAGATVRDPAGRTYTALHVGDWGEYVAVSLRQTKGV